jgi:hypothetical protein
MIKKFNYEDRVTSICHTTSKDTTPSDIDSHTRHFNLFVDLWAYALHFKYNRKYPSYSMVYPAVSPDAAYHIKIDMSNILSEKKYYLDKRQNNAMNYWGRLIRGFQNPEKLGKWNATFRAQKYDTFIIIDVVYYKFIE